MSVKNMGGTQRKGGKGEARRKREETTSETIGDGTDPLDYRRRIAPTVPEFVQSCRRRRSNSLNAHETRMHKGTRLWAIVDSETANCPFIMRRNCQSYFVADPENGEGYDNWFKY